MNRLLDIYFYSKDPSEEIFKFLYGSEFDCYSQLDELLPFDYLSQRKTLDLLGVVNRFLSEEVIQVSSKEERARKLRPYMSDPKVLTRLLCGISSIQYDYKEWKKTLIWNAAERFKFEKVYEVIVEFLAVHRQQEHS